jgi:acylphosphatase
MERRRYRVYGRVQGVGFRAFVWREAQHLDVAGWVRNRFDGTVEVLADATAAEHERLALILERGPRMSRVDRVESASERAEEQPMSGFTVAGDV